MQSYKKWKTLNESFGPGSFNLGLSNPTNLGLSSQFGSFTDVIEGKKKSKADSDTDAVEVDVDGEAGWDDVEDDVEEGCGCNASKKKSAKKSTKTAAKKSTKTAAKKSGKNMDSDMGGDFEDDDGEDHDDHDDEESDDEGDEDEGDGDDMGDEESDMGDDEGDDEGEEEEGGDEEPAPMFSKKKSGKKSAKTAAKKSEKKSTKTSAKKSEKKSAKTSDKTMQKEWWKSDDEEWMKSVQSMLGPKAVGKNRDGWSEYQEDALLPAVNSNGGSDGEVAPLPGEVGFAPQQRLDTGNGLSLGEAVKVIEEAVETAGPKLQRKLLRKLTELHRKLS